MEIIREKDSLGFDVIKLIKENATLTIYFGGNGDVYWDLMNIDNIDSQDESFIISENDGPIYDLFHKLFLSISNYQIFQVNEEEASYCRNSEELRILREKERKYNEKLVSHPYFKDLCNGTYVEWHSDNEPFETGNILMLLSDSITKTVTINIKRVSPDYGFLIVCFTHSGSRYRPFDLAFYEHYRKLCEMDLASPPPSTDMEDSTKKGAKLMLNNAPK